MNILEYEKYRQTVPKKASHNFISNVISLMPLYIKQHGEFLTLEKNSILLGKSEEVSYAIIIVYGELTVVNEFESGKIYEPVIMNHSEFTGVVEIISNQKEIISTNLTVNEVGYIRIPKKYFLKWLDENHEITKLVLDSVCANFSKDMHKSGENILLDSMYLLVNHLLKKAALNTRMDMYILNETRERTSNRTGINLRTLYRHIKKLKQAGFVTVYKRKIVFSEEQKIILYDYYLELRNK